MTSSKPQAQAQTETHPINITPMSAIEARECLNAIKSNLESLRLMLLELHRRRGWEALGYASWEDCAIEEFGKSRSYVFRLLAAAEVEENLATSKSTIVDLMDECTIVDLENIPITQLSELAKLPPEQQVEGLLKAEEIAQAQGKKRNATHVVQAVKEIKPKKQTLTQPAKADEANSTDQPKTGWDISPQTLTTTVKGHLIAVDFERRDKEYFFGFRGAGETISASGFHEEHWNWNGSKIHIGYANPGLYADFRACELYAEHQLLLAENINMQDTEMEDTGADANTDNGSNAYTPAGIDAVTDSVPESALPPTPTTPERSLTLEQMVSAAVSACLGDFTIPVSLDEPLSGRVYVSPSKAIGAWTTKLLKAYKSDSVEEAIALLTLDHQAFARFADYAVCPLDDMVAVYLGKRVEKFVLCFEELGTVWHRYGWHP